MAGTGERSFQDDMADAPDLAMVLNLDEAGMVEWAASFLRKRGWRVGEPARPRMELPGQTTVEEQIAQAAPRPLREPW